MIQQRVHPDIGSREGKWVLLTISLILLVTVVVLPFRQAANQHVEIAKHQILLADVVQEDLAMIAELRLAHEEIRDLHADLGEWLPIAELQQEWLAPFVEDQSWQRKGAHQWSLLGEGVYLGVRTQEAGSASIILDARGEEPDMWLATQEPLNANGHVELIQPQQRIDATWQQIVFASQENAASVHAH